MTELLFTEYNSFSNKINMFYILFLVKKETEGNAIEIITPHIHE